jgi:hypothetical protein
MIPARCRRLANRLAKALFPGAHHTRIDAPTRPRDHVFLDKAMAFVSEGLGLAVHLQGFNRVMGTATRRAPHSLEEGT